MSEQQSFETRKRARRRALQALYQWQITGQSAQEILAQFKEEQDLSLVDPEFFQGLLIGVVKEKKQLDQKLESFLDRPVDDVDMMERAVLRLAVYELLHHPETPYKVVLNEAVDLAKSFGAEQGHTYVNGVLDQVAAEVRSVEKQA